MPLDPLYHDPIEVSKVRKRSNSIPEINPGYFTMKFEEFDTESLGKREPEATKIKPIFKITEGNQEMTREEYIQDLRLLLLKRRFTNEDEFNTE